MLTSKEALMQIGEAFDQVAAGLKTSREKGVKPVIRVSGDDWVCTLDEPTKKTVIIAKEGQLVLVDMESNKAEPHIERIQAPEYTRKALIERIQQAITEAYGTTDIK